MANSYVSGVGGRVNTAASGATPVAGVKSWRLDQVAGLAEVTNFESVFDAVSQPRLWREYLVGLCGATGTLEGVFDTNASNPTDAPIYVGIQVVLRLLFSKTSRWGFTVTALVTAFGSGTNVDNQPATFTASFTVTGIVPLSAVTTA